VHESTDIMNWDDLKYFLELARQKRLNRVGRRLGVDHTTVARRIGELEAELGCRLFESGPEGYLVTEAGRRLIAHAENVESSIGFLREDLVGEGDRVRGKVRIGTPEGLGTTFLTPRLHLLAEEHADLDIELLTPPRFPSLAAREADLIVTLDPPQQGQYVASRLTDYTYGLYASEDYLQRHGPIRRRSQLAEHAFVGYIEDMLLSPQLRYLDELIPVHRLRLASSGMLAQLAAVRSGLGLGVLAHYLAADTGLVPVLPAEASWKRTFWLAAHADWHRLRRVKAVWDFVRRIVAAEQHLFIGRAAARPAKSAPTARARRDSP
jgi:DNA-binding transcriptional LysR family regulator